MFCPYLPKFMVNWETRNILLSVFEAFWNWYLLFPLVRCVPWALAYTYYHQISQFLKFHHWLFLFNFVTCVLGVFDGQKRAPSVCVCSFELSVWAGAKFLGEFNARPGGTFSYHGGMYLFGAHKLPHHEDKSSKNRWGQLFLCFKTLNEFEGV